jgi:exodeoxyribonuclease-3
MYKMRIISYNVNGTVQRFRKDLWLQQANPDVICLQVKATPEQIPLLDFELAGYPYHYWFPATKGYSGTAILSKIKPNNVLWNWH